MKKKNASAFLHKSKRGILHVIFSPTMIVLLALAANFVLLFLLMLGIFQNVPLLFGGTVAFTAVMLLVVLNTQENPSVKLSWCITIAVLPLFGAILYVFIRLDLGHRLEQKRIRETVEAAAAALPPSQVDLNRLRQRDKALSNLGAYLRQHGCGQVYENTQVTYFPLGEDKFARMLPELEKAERFIFMEYFSIAPSYMWDTILEILARKAKQGVEVRVMYDGGCAVADLPHNYPKKLAELGIACKVFAPFRPIISTHYNNRDHRKILVIDGKVAFTGGVNLLDRYINRKAVFGHWKDTAVMLQGEAARCFTAMFLHMWNCTEKEGAYEAYLNAPVPPVQADGYVIPYCDSPLDNEHVGEMVYLDILNRAQSYVYIMTPYLILDNEMLTALTFAAKRGVDVRLVLPHIPDKRLAFALAKSHYRELTGAGVKIYEYTPGFVHAKVFLSDDREAVVGTINLDYRSLYLHFECAAYLQGVSALGDIRQDFEETFVKSQLITPEQARKQNLLTRVAGGLMKALAPLM